jgi:XRE family transcriptional regulator, regulator of sulfur utilization
MYLHQKIITARTRSGLTQEELANRCGITARTIQRIESGTTTPRSFTLRSIATALNVSFEELNEAMPGMFIATDPGSSETNVEQHRHFLHMLCLSCFSYLLIPYLHFLVPVYLLRKEKVTDLSVLRSARNIISAQVYWVVANTIVLLLTLGLNLGMAAYHIQARVSYILVFFISYVVNAVIILNSYREISRYNG